MTRVSKRKSDQEGSAPLKITRGDCARSASSKAGMKLLGRIDDLYSKYTNVAMGMIDPEGIERLCSDLKVEVTDVRILMFAWKLKAEKQGYFTQDEWRRGLKSLHVDNITKMKKSLPDLEKEALKSENFDDFYMFAFRYCLTEEKQKCLDMETTCSLIEMVLGSKYRPQVDAFLEFLKIQNEYKVINFDQWMNILRFCQEISFPDLQNYDSCQAWALILDNFVEWMKTK